MADSQSDVTLERSAGPLEHLHYGGPLGWFPLPAWARFLTGVGAHASSWPAESHLVIVLSLPAREFAACFVAAGAVINAFLESPPDTDASRHFKYLAGLVPGTMVTRRCGESIERGRLLGVETVDGVEFVSVQFKKSVNWLPVSLCLQIQPTDGRAGTAMSRRKLVRAPGFLERVCPDVDVSSFCATTRLDCVIVGSQGTLREELIAKQFGAGYREVTHRGALQDLVRARYLMGANDAFRSTVLPASSEASEKPLSLDPPRVVIFDGSLAFNNWRSHWERSHWIVLLDRSSSSALDGAAAVAQAFAMRADDAFLPERLGVPPSVEALAYLEAR